MYRFRLRDLREDADLKQADIAKILNCSQTCYSKWELEQRDIPKRALIKLAEYYRTSTDYILGLTDIRDPYPEHAIKKSVPVNRKENTSADKAPHP